MCVTWGMIAVFKWYIHVTPDQDMLIFFLVMLCVWFYDKMFNVGRGTFDLFFIRKLSWAFPFWIYYKPVNIVRSSYVCNYCQIWFCVWWPSNIKQNFLSSYSYLSCNVELSVTAWVLLSERFWKVYKMKCQEYEGWFGCGVTQWEVYRFVRDRKYHLQTAPIWAIVRMVCFFKECSLKLLML